MVLQYVSELTYTETGTEPKQAVPVLSKLVLRHTVK